MARERLGEEDETMKRMQGEEYDLYDKLIELTTLAGAKMYLPFYVRVWLWIKRQASRGEAR